MDILILTQTHSCFSTCLHGAPHAHTGPQVLALEQSWPPQADVLPAAGLARNLSAARCLRELRLCKLHLLHPIRLCSALANLRLLRVLDLDYVEAYEQASPELECVITCEALLNVFRTQSLLSAQDPLSALHGVAWWT